LLGVLGFAKTHLEVDGSAGSWWKGFSRLYLLGMNHIAEGSDHLLFLLVAIAASILISSIHAWRPLFAGRESWIALTFGLVHGLAFGWRPRLSG
jgi:hypothetical protein